MDTKKIKSLLNSVKNGKISIDKALDTLKHLPYEDMGFAKIDHHRGIRNSIPEVIFAKNNECMKLGSDITYGHLKQTEKQNSYQM